MITIIKNARIVNEGQVFEGAIFIENGLIIQVLDNPQPEITDRENFQVIDAQQCFLLPGLIDDQVHFREPGLTHKADIASESKAAVAGGITSFMEMPNTIPQATNISLLNEKFAIAAQTSLANYSFYLGATNDNIDELLKADLENICGVKVFMGSSTGNMLVDKQESLEAIFSQCQLPIAVHCEDEATIKSNLADFKARLGDEIKPWHHHLIRNHQACLLSSTLAASLARKHNSRLHILHLSTAEEMNLFNNQNALEDKKITAEVCVHHLWFSDQDYHQKGNLIKWNPAVKTADDREALWQALLEGKIDVVATDHAPHLLEEKQKNYPEAPSGGPLVQHALQAMVDMTLDRQIPIHQVVQWMCHNPAIAFKVQQRGFIRPGYFADLVILNPEKPYTVSTDNILYKCRWSPFQGHTFKSSITHTFVNGQLVYENGHFHPFVPGMPLKFKR